MNKVKLTEMFSQRLDDIEHLKQSKDFYELEKQFDVIMKEMGNELLGSLLKSPSADRRKKSLFEPPMGK